MIFWKYLLIRFGLIVVILTMITGGITLLFYNSEVETANTLLEGSEAININSSREAINKKLGNIAADLMILSQHDSFTQIETEEGIDTDALAEDMLIMIREKKIYDQLRFLDDTGMEIVRVNFNKEQSHIVAQANLQNKSERYYFKETLVLSRGEVFISPFDLNVENGKIELPYKPMIRFGTPVFDKQGNKRGVVIVNYFGAELIHDLLIAASNIIDHVTLLNSDGYWLRNPDTELEWGFMLEHDQRFRNLFPGSWERITNVDSGQFLDSNGLFTFDTVYPLSEKQKVGSSIRAVNSMSSNYYWKIVSHVSLATIDAANSNIRAELLNVIAPLYLLMVLGCFGLAYVNTRRKQAEDELQKSYGELELRVEERTIELSRANEALTDDIIERKRMEEALQKSESRFRNLFENAEVSIWNEDMSDIYEALEQLRMKGVIDLHQYITDNPQVAWDMVAKVKVIQINEATLELFGAKTENELLNQIDKTFGENTIEVFIEELCAIWGGERVFHAEADYISLNGKDINTIISFQIPDTAEGFKSIPVSIIDITERKLAEEKLKYMVAHDSLTGLYSRREMKLRLTDEIERASRYKHPLSVFMLDLDHFKHVNDSYGHLVGDQVLGNFAKLLKNSIRTSDYAARYGGEEFVVVLPEAPLAKAEELAERLRKLIADCSFPVKIDKELKITVSIGIATFPEHAQTTKDLLEAVDSAMYAAKEAGRNQVKVSSCTSTIAL